MCGTRTSAAQVVVAWVVLHAAVRMEHADLDALIDGASEQALQDELMLRRLKKRRLVLRDQIAQLEMLLLPQEPA